MSAQSSAQLRLIAGDAEPAASPLLGSPQVYVHIGEPKTGTTFLQQVLWRNRSELAVSGVMLPGPRPLAHWRATQDLREVPQLDNDPIGPFSGAWDRLARQALRAPRVAVISHELLAAASMEQASRAVRSLQPAEVHVVLTIRDVASLLPAEWQETVKHRNARSWPDWLGDVIDREADAPDRRQWWFWRVHDTLEILRAWSEHLPPERVHVITTPPRGSSQQLLWDRFARVIGVESGAVDTTRARSNVSLGLPEIEMLRRVNDALPDEVPGWFYMRHVKDLLAHGSLAARPSAGRLELPADRDAWAADQSRALIEALRASPYDLVGDLDELLPRPVHEPRAHPDEVTADQMLDAAVDAITTLITEAAATHGVDSERQADARPHGSARGPLKRAAIAASQRSLAVHRVRRGYWHAINTVRQLRAASRRRGDEAGAP